MERRIKASAFDQHMKGYTMATKEGQHRAYVYCAAVRPEGKGWRLKDVAFEGPWIVLTWVRKGIHREDSCNR